jgi:uncharacterized protein
MDLKTRLLEATKEAMKARAADRLSALRMISAGLKDREIAARGEGAEVSGADQLAYLGKMVKQRQESARAYEAGGRPELAAKEKAEITVIEEFLPRQMSGAEVDAAIAAAIAEVGAGSIKDMGKVMAALKVRFTGQMDFGAVGAAIKARLG